jgi:hypothetical protein
MAEQGVNAVYNAAQAIIKLQEFDFQAALIQFSVIPR